jgi:hypothetical protein
VNIGELGPVVMVQDRGDVLRIDAVIFTVAPGPYWVWSVDTKKLFAVNEHGAFKTCASTRDEDHDGDATRPTVLAVTTISDHRPARERLRLFVTRFDEPRSAVIERPLL